MACRLFQEKSRDSCSDDHSGRSAHSQFCNNTELVPAGARLVGFVVEATPSLKEIFQD